MTDTLPAIPVLIVGAGPTGLALACVLARGGIDFRIVDKAAAYFTGSRGKGLQPRSLEVLDDLGLIDRILANGRFHIPFRAYAGTTALGDRDMHEGHHATPAVPYGSTLLIAQWRVEDALRHGMNRFGKEVEMATELTALEQDDTGVEVTLLKDGSENKLRCRYLVGTDGGHSFVRKALGIGFEGETWKDERMFVGDVRVDGLDRDHWHAWPQHPKGFVALCPLPSSEYYQFQAQIAPDVDQEPSLEIFQEILNERAGRTDLVLEDAGWMSLYRANVRMVDSYRVNNAFICGDAAHVHSPAGGQGMNTGIQDAYNLGWKLAAVLNGADEKLLESYEEERLPVAAAMLGITTRLHRQIFTDNAREMTRGEETLQLSINYRNGFLSRETGSPLVKVRAGDRAPDAPVLDENGERIELFDVFRGPRFVLLSLGAGRGEKLTQLAEEFKPYLSVCSVVTAAQAESDSVRIVVDDQSHVANAYGGGAFVVVRPDGYIGWIGDRDSVAAAGAYLSEVIGLKRA